MWGLQSNFVECESFPESNSSSIITLCETNLNDSNDSGEYICEGYLPLIWKDFIAHVLGIGIYIYEEVISQKLYRFLFMFLYSFTSFSVLLFVLLMITCFVFIYSFWCYFIQGEWGILLGGGYWLVGINDK